ncbi:MAG: hypothetical protein P4L41_15310 [Flavipsychrobacter sp.]|nr:hypothetical protein [Flavipsychrobacter sp.]
MRFQLFLLLFCILGWHSNANGQAKTDKNTTIKWLTDKINRYGLRVDVSDNLDQAFEYSRVTGDKHHPVLVERIEYSTNYEEDYVHFDEVSGVDSVYDATNVIPDALKLTARTADKSTMSNMHFGTAVLRLDWNAEPGLYSRMLKAFKALAEYNYGGTTAEAY